MTPTPAPRRSFLASLLAGIAAPFAGLLGGRAKAGEYTVQQLIADATRPVAGYEYQVPWQNADGTVGGTYGPTESLDFAIQQWEVYVSEGYSAEIRRRAVGEWRLRQAYWDGSLTVGPNYVLPMRRSCP